MVISGNSVLNKLACKPSAPTITSYPLFSKALIKGISRVAWPKPQSSGATKTLRMLKLPDKSLKRV